MPMWRMITAMSAAPRGPENIDGSSYLYITLVRHSPLASADTPRTLCACCHALEKRASRRPPLYSRSVLQSLRQVKSLTHIPPALQAGFRPLALLNIGDRAQRCTADLLGILRQRAAARIGFRCPPNVAPALQLGGRDMQSDFTTLCINRDFIAVFHERDRTAERRFRRYVADHEAVAAPGKPPVGDERDAVAQTLADDGAGRAQHLAHPRAALRTLVTDDNDIPRLDLAAENSRARGLL